MKEESFEREARPSRFDCMALRKIRMGVGMSQEKLAEMTGTTRLTVIKWEAGSDPSATNLANMADALAVHPSQLLTESSTSRKVRRTRKAHGEDLADIEVAAREMYEELSSLMMTTTGAGEEHADDCDLAVDCSCGLTGVARQLNKWKSVIYKEVA